MDSFPDERVLRFNAQGPEGLIGSKAPGKQPLLNAAQREALAGIVEAGPKLALHGVVRWRIVDLVAWLQSTFAVTVSPQTLSRELRALGYRKLSARPRHHVQAEGAIADFKKTSPPCWQRSGKAFHPERR